MFTWCLRKNYVVPTEVTFTKKRVSLPTVMCSLCEGEREDALHVLEACPYEFEPDSNIQL